MRRQQLEKKPEKPFMMYFAFDNLQVFTISILSEQMSKLCRSHLSILTLSFLLPWMFLTDIPGPVASGRKMEGSVSLPGGYWLPWWCQKDETAVSLSSLALNLALTSLVDLLMISHRLATKIDLEVRHVRNEALSYPASSTFEPFVNNVDSNDDEND